MPYMPTNFYPKNQSIVKGELGFTNFYCLVNKYDTIYKAVLRLYSYYDESTTYPKKVFVMETRNGELWKYDTSSPGLNLYNDAEDAELPFSTNEENDGVFSFSIANSDLETNRQMTWTLELYGDEDDYTVFIFDGKIQSASGNTVEVFATPLLQAGQKIVNKLENAGTITSVTSYLDVSGLGVYKKGGIYEFNTPLEIDKEVANKLHNNTSTYEFQHLFIDIGSFTYQNNGDNNSNKIESITFELDTFKKPKAIKSITLDNTNGVIDTDLLGESGAGSIELYSNLYLQCQQITYDTTERLKLKKDNYFQVLGNSVTSFENPFKIYEASNPSIDLNIYNDNLTMTELDPNLFCGWYVDENNKMGLAIGANSYPSFSYLHNRSIRLETTEKESSNISPNFITLPQQDAVSYFFRDGSNRINGKAEYTILDDAKKKCQITIIRSNKMISTTRQIKMMDDSFHYVRIGFPQDGKQEPTIPYYFGIHENSKVEAEYIGELSNIKVEDLSKEKDIEITFTLSLTNGDMTFSYDDQSKTLHLSGREGNDTIIDIRLDYVMTLIPTTTTEFQPNVEISGWIYKNDKNYCNYPLEKVGLYERDVNVDSIVKEFSASYFNKNYINWYQWKLYNSFNELVYEQEKQFNKKLSNFVYDRFEDGQDYILEITIADRRGFTSSDKTNIHVKLKPYEKGAAPELSLDNKRKAIKIDWSKTIDLNASGVNADSISFYEDPESSDDDNAYIYTKQDLTYNTLGGQPMNFSEIGKFQADFKLSSSSPQNILSFTSNGNIYQIKIKEDLTNIIVTLDINGQQSTNFINLYEGVHTAFIEEGTNKDNLLYKIIDGEDNVFIPSEENNGYVIFYNNRGCNKFSSIKYEPGKLSLSIENELNSTIVWSLDMKNVTSVTFHGNKYWKDIVATGTQDEVLMKSAFDVGSLNFGGNISPSNTELLYYSLYRVNLTDDPDTYTKIDDFDTINDIKIIRDYAVNSKNTYIYTLVPIFKFNDTGLLVGGNSRSTDPITPDWDEVTLLGTLNRYEGNNTSNIYRLDPRQNWHFELDVQDNNINFTTNKADVAVNSQYPRKSETVQNFMSGSITTKLGYLQNDFEYMDDNIQALKRFQNFANQNYVKILRLRNGFVIPVDITLTSSANQNNLIGNPTDITFDWSQIADTEHLSLWEAVSLDEDDTERPDNNYYANNVAGGGR